MKLTNVSENWSHNPNNIVWFIQYGMHSIVDTDLNFMIQICVDWKVGEVVDFIQRAIVAELSELDRKYVL